MLESALGDLARNYLGSRSMTTEARVVVRGKRGREKLYYENIRLSLRLGKKEEIDQLIAGREARLEFLRRAVDREIERLRAEDEAAETDGDQPAGRSGRPK